MGLDSVSIGISGLLSFQRAMATTSHNITNADTEGFSRQRVGLTVNDSMFTGDGFIGTGTGVSTISRVWDRFTFDNLNTVTSNASQFETLKSLSAKMDNIFSDENSGLSPTIQDFFTSMQAVSESPSSSSAKRQLLSASDAMAKRFNSLQSLIGGLENESQGRLKNIVREVNSYTAALSDLNQKIVNASVSEFNQPNDLLDQRDRLLLNLSEKLNIKTMENDNGSISVFIGNGQPLVTDRFSNRLVLAPNSFDNSKMEIGLTTTSSSNILNISSMIESGELGAVLNFRENAIPETKSSIGKLAAWISESVNKQHNVSVDKNGNFGSNMFVIDKYMAQSSSLNTGNGIISTVFNKDAITSLTGDSYRLTKTATSWTILNTNTRTTYTPPAGVNNFAFEGFDVSLEPGGTPATDDVFLINPTEKSAATIRSALNSADLVATAYPITTSSVNDYGVTISSGELDYSIIDASFPIVPSELQNDYLVTLDKATSQFNIALASNPSVIIASSAFNTAQSEQTITYGAWSFTISGDIPDLAVFNLNTTTGTSPSGDNRGIMDLADQQFKNLFMGGTETMHGVYEDIVARTGSASHNNSINYDAQNALYTQAVQRRDEVSGVNLDEEAAMLIKLQQAYQAAAKVIQVSDKMFQVLINTL
jgi:flagellar hook-associated protein 1 FlgK